MKRFSMIVLILIILSIGVPVNGFAYTYTSNLQYVEIVYSPAKDEYIINYYLADAANAITYVFFAMPGNTYTKTWPSRSINKTIYVNCNGVGDYFFKLNGVTVASIEEILFTEIENPLCLAKIGNENELNLNGSGTAGDGSNGANPGQYRIDYTKIPGGVDYQLQKSTDGGTTWTTTANNSTGDDYFIVNENGFFRINVTDENGDLIARDIIGTDEFSAGCVDGCNFLSEILACPGWDEFLGDFSTAIADAIPTPSDLGSSIATSIVDKLAEQNVTPDDPIVPAPFDPGYPEQQTDIPAPVTTDINPAPTDFEPETGGDGNGAFDLTDPLDWTPDDNDKAGGYVPPDPDSDNPPVYTEPGGDDENPPTYDPPGGGDDTPPTYNPPGGAGDDMPDYNHPDESSPPAYDGGGTSGDDVPNYDYGG